MGTPMSVDVRRLLLLADVAEHGSLTGAAAALGYTTSAISQQLRRLESEAGQPLLERLPRGIRLTEAGAALATRASAIRRQLRAAESDLAEHSGLRAGSLRIGSFPTASASLLPLVVTRFHQRWPDIDLTVHSALLAPLIDLLHSGEVELALLWDYPWNRLRDPGLTSVHLLDDPPVLVVPAASDLPRERPVTMADLADRRWVVRSETHPASDLLLRSCVRAGYEPRITYRAQDYQEIQAMVAAGLGIALAPRLGLTNLRDDVRLVSIAADDDVPHRRILLSRVRDRPARPAAAAIERAFAEVAESLSVSRLGRHQLGSVRDGADPRHDPN
ncbi:LysR family transcriptional regulator [Naumannella huperziae]